MKLIKLLCFFAEESIILVILIIIAAGAIACLGYGLGFLSVVGWLAGWCRNSRHKTR